jgi:hypothetical protein
MHHPASWYRTSDRHLAADLGRVGTLMVWRDLSTRARYGWPSTNADQVPVLVGQPTRSARPAYRRPAPLSRGGARDTDALWIALLPDRGVASRGVIAIDLRIEQA